LGGAEKQLLELCREQRASGYEVCVIYLSGSGYLKTFLSKFQVEVISIAHLSFAAQLIQLHKLLRKRHFDILHAHLPRSEILACLAKKNEKLIVSRHNCESFWPDSNSCFSRNLSKFVLRRSSHLISISKSVEDFLNESDEIPLSCNKSIIHYGYQRNNNLPYRKSTFKQNSSVRILAVGRLVDQKNYELMFQSLAQVTSISYTLTICGSGILEKPLRKLAKHLNIEENIVWKGKVPNIFSEYEGHDLLLHTSKYEGFGLVYLEALDANIPILTSDNQAAREIFGLNYGGYFENGNKSDLVRKLNSLVDSKVLSEWQSSNLNILKNFTSNVMWQKILVVYLEALGKNKQESDN